MPQAKYLVTGSTGKTGRHTVSLLLKQGHAVRALVRKEDDRSAALRAAGAEVVQGDLLNHDDALRATSGITSAYFCYPVRAGLVQATAYFAHAARRAGVAAVVNMSQISAREDSKSHAARDHWIAERMLDWSGVPTVHLRPTFFAEWLTYPWIAAAIRQESKITFPYGNGRHAPIAAQDQARLIAAILAHPVGHTGNTYTLHGPVEMRQQEIAEAISGVVGRKISYEPMSLEQYRRSMTQAGLPDVLVQHCCEVAIDYQNGLFAGTNEIIERVTGKAPQSIEEFVRSHRAELEPQ